MRSALLGVVIAVSLTGLAGPADAEPLDMATDVLRTGLQQSVAAGYPGTIGLLRDGDNVRFAHAGVGDLATGVPADPAGKFRIGSVTKAFMATVVLQLAAEGRLSLDDTVERWLPGVVHANGHEGDRISIRQLLNHSSGLLEYVNDPWNGAQYVAILNPYQRWTRESLIAIGTSRPPAFAPGMGFAYSNTNYLLAGMIIEAVTGNDPADEIQRRIAEPLGLQHSELSNSPILQGNWIHGYFLIRDVSISPVNYHRAGVGMVSTLDDLVTFTRAQLDGRLLAPAQLRELRTTIPTGEGARAEYGLGVFRAASACGPIWLYSGTVLGYFTLVLSDDSGHRQLAVMGNEQHFTPAVNSELLTDSAERAFCAI